MSDELLRYSVKYDEHACYWMILDSRKLPIANFATVHVYGTHGAESLARQIADHLNALEAGQPDKDRERMAELERQNAAMQQALERILEYREMLENIVEHFYDLPPDAAHALAVEIPSICENAIPRPEPQYADPAEFDESDFPF